jgi:hypothetical protein
MPIALLKYRHKAPGFELPDAVRARQEAYDDASARRLEEMAERIENQVPGSMLGTLRLSASCSVHGLDALTDSFVDDDRLVCTRQPWVGIRKAACPLLRDQRGRTRTRIPYFGRNVMVGRSEIFCPGSSWNRNRDKTIARMETLSSSANCSPMQVRVPPPNGK